MNNRTADLLSLLCLLVPVVSAAYLWPVLPDPMPSHWNAAGEVDGYLPKFWGVVLLPLAAAGSWLLLKVVPVISPKGFRTESFRGTLNVFQVTLVGFLSLVAMLVLLEARGIDTHMHRTMFAATGILFVVIGSLLSRVRKNFFIGIRTPWTLASDEVWARTHRLGGRLFVVAGLLLAIGGLAGWPVLPLIGAVLACALYPVLHSYLLYRRLEGFPPAGSDD